MRLIKQSEVNILEIIEALKQGKVIIYPTETCYGLGCDATNAEAVKKIFTIKKREENKSVLVLMADVEMSKKYVQWPSILESLSQKYWPGPLTVVAKVKKNTGLAAGVSGADNTLAFRISDNNFANELVKKLNRPLVSTSANIAGEPAPYNIEEVMRMFGNTGLVRRSRRAKPEPDIIIDGGILPFCKLSTIVRIIKGRIEVLRQGEIVIKIT